jgi:hypothetical protein
MTSVKEINQLWKQASHQVYADELPVTARLPTIWT